MGLRLPALIALLILTSAVVAAPSSVPAELPKQLVDRDVASPASPVAADWFAASGAKLENRKLELEITKLEADLSSWDKNLLIQAGTLLAAFLAVLISGWSAAKTLRLQLDASSAQNDSRRRDRVSGLLKELGSESVLVRSAAIQALSEYEEAIPFLVNALRSERDPEVLNTTIISLNSHPKRALSLLLEQSKHIYAQKLSLASSLAPLGQNRKNVALEFNLRNKDIMNWEESGAGRRASDATPTAEEESIAARKDQIATRVREAREQLTKEFITHANCLQAIESLLSLPDFKGESLALTDAYLAGLRLDQVDMAGWDFSGSILDRATFRNCDCTGASFEQVQAKEVSFRGSAMSEASFDQAELIKVDLRDISGVKMSFRGAIVRDAKADRARIDDVIFSEAELLESDIRNSDLRRANFSGSKLFSTTFDTCRMSDSCFDNALLIKVKLRSLRCRRAAFKNASFSGVLIFKGDFSGSSYAGSRWLDTRVRLPVPVETSISLTDRPSVR